MEKGSQWREIDIGTTKMIFDWAGIDSYDFVNLHPQYQATGNEFITATDITTKIPLNWIKACRWDAESLLWDLAVASCEFWECDYLLS